MRNLPTTGFTLIETMVVMGIILLCACTLSFIDIQTYRHDALSEERMRIVSLLEDARTQAMHNHHERPHGVALYPDGRCVSFAGDSFASAIHQYDIVSMPTYPITLGDMPREIVFAQQSGDAQYDGTIELHDPVRNTSVFITINHEGAIGW